MKKNFLAMGLSITLLVMSLTGCSALSSSAAVSSPSASSKADVSQSAEKKNIKVAFSLDQMSEGNAVLVDGMKQWVDAFNASSDTEKVELTVFDATASVEKQISDVDTIIVDGYNILIFSCVDSQGSIPAMEAAHKAGLKVIDVRDTGNPAADVGASFQDESVMTGKIRDWMQKSLDADPNNTWNVGIVYGTSSQTLQLERGDFVKRWAEEEKRVKVVADAYGKWDTGVSMGIVEDWLQTHDDINIIIAANIGMAQGASAALKTAKLKDKVKVVTFDITDDTLLNIRDGVIDAAVGMNMTDMGKAYMDLALKVMHGEYTDKKYINKDMIIVDIDNYKEYMK